jgi:NADH dehydrogenase
VRGLPEEGLLACRQGRGGRSGLGLHKGVAMIATGMMKIKLKGRLAGTCTVAATVAMPTRNREIRISADWTLGMLLKREAVSLGPMENPAEFSEAAEPPPVAAAATADKTGANAKVS